MSVRSAAAAFAVVAILSACRTTPVRPAIDPLAEARRIELRQLVVTDSVREVLARGLRDSAYPAAYAVIGSSRAIYASVGVGGLEPTSAPPRDTVTFTMSPPQPTVFGDAGTTRQLDINIPRSRPAPMLAVTDSTVWDLASLTKVLATTSAVLQLVADGRVQLDAPARTYLPRWRAPGTDSITVRHLLTHSSGLPAWRPLYKEAWSAEEAMAQVYATAPDTAPGLRYVYSDLGFILLGELVAHVSGVPLDSYVLANVFLPLDMRETRFHPSALWRTRTAATEIDPWRQRWLRGEVHDENSFQLGAVSGHAGLFSTARDLTRLAQALLLSGWSDSLPESLRSAVRVRELPVFDAATLRAFTQRQSVVPGSHRALGWETPTGRNSGGQRLSALAFGHTGFTGTSIWMDPEQDLFVILLTNRVNPTRERSGIGGVRSALANAVVGAINSLNAP